MSGKTIRSLVKSWETVRFELLKTRISALDLDIEGSPLEALRRPPAPGDGGQAVRLQAGSLPDGQLGLPGPDPGHRHPLLPGRPGLARLEEEQTGEVEDPKTIMMFLRHEAGHAVNYAYRLWRRPAGARSSAPSPSPTGRTSGPNRFEPPVRPPHRRLPLRPDLRPEAPGRGLRRDLRRLADAALRLARALPELARPAQAAVRRPADEGHPPAPRRKAAAAGASAPWTA